MSYLDVPRVHFRGRMVVNVGTANNNYEGVEPPPLDVANVRVDTGGRSPEDFRQWLEAPMDDRSAAIALDKRVPWLRSGWNYLGDYGCGFQDARVTSVALGDRVVTLPHEDALIGASVRLNRAVMVDLDPTGIDSTQIFGDEWELSGPGGLGCRGQPSRFFSRWINCGRNPSLGRFSAYSAVFQAAVAAPVTFEGSSPCLDALRDALKDAAGLSVRFCVYAVTFPIPLDVLRDRYVAGEHPQNPGVGCMVGAVGPWRADEPRSFSLGRHLVLRPADDTGPRLGDALAVVDPTRRVVTLDVMSTFPEAGASLEKVKLGPAHLRAVVADGPAVDVGQVPYDKETYETFGGIVELPLTPGQLEHVSARRLCLHTSGAELRETDVTVDTDDRCVYLDEGEPGSVRLLATVAGSTPGEAVEFAVVCEPPIVDVPSSVIVPPREEAAFIVRGLSPGVARVSVRPVGHDGGCDVHVRVLPDDGHLLDKEVTFELLYREVLRYYDLIHPAMSTTVIDLGDERNWRDPGFCKVVLARIRADKESFAYMPRSRDLSRGKRTLLERWCERVCDGAS